MASSQPSTRTARPTRVSSTDSAAAPPWRTRTWRRTGSALLPAGSSPTPAAGARGVRMAPVTPPSRRVASAAWAERRPSTTTAATPAPMAASKAASHPSSISTRSTREPTTPSTSRSSSRPPAPCRSARARSSASARAAVRWRASSAWSADTCAVSAACTAASSSAATRRQLCRQRRRRPFELVGLAGQQVGPYRGARRALLEGCDPGPQGVHVLLLARRGPAHRLDPRPDPGDGLVRRVLAQHRRPARPQRRRLVLQGGQRGLELGPFGRPAGFLLGLRRHELAGQARRLGLEGGDHVDVGGRVERGHHATAPLTQHAGEPTGPLHQSLHPAQCVGQVLLAA